MRLLDGGDNVKTKRLVKTKCLVQEILINVFRLVYSIASVRRYHRAKFSDRNDSWAEMLYFEYILLQRPYLSHVGALKTSKWRKLTAISQWEPFQFLIVCSLCVIFEEFLHEATALFSEQNGWAIAFEVLFLFKYLKVVVHTISFLLYRPFPIPANPTVRCSNVTVIIPTVGAIDEPEFRETIRSILINRPFEVIVCTVGGDKFRAAEKVCAEEAYPLPTFDPATRVKVMAISHASKRDQVFAAIQEVQTSTIIALADDHVFWGPHFLRASLAPFEDHRIGAVGTNVSYITDENILIGLIHKLRRFVLSMLDIGLILIPPKTESQQCFDSKDIQNRQCWLGDFAEESSSISIRVHLGQFSQLRRMQLPGKTQLRMHCIGRNRPSRFCTFWKNFTLSY